MREVLNKIEFVFETVRLFLSKDSPSQVGLNSQDHLQAKASLVLPPGGPASDDILPPGFEGTHTSMYGKESKEVEDQRQREMRVLEAIYPRISSIPPKFVSRLCLVL
ncbi:hypothetical protein VNO80_15847 [Phaseolus coccineus]|uniref:Uncharacterized protein n=1 Tax=Phaseolus coccineus TaxID=3886 RepID=A0AAN9MS54_PHACN